LSAAIFEVITYGFWFTVCFVVFAPSPPDKTGNTIASLIFEVLSAVQLLN